MVYWQQAQAVLFAGGGLLKGEGGGELGPHLQKQWRLQ